ncbi:CHASE3 domain-containing protein [Granulicella aggregans]|uniref:CHASE3 domain-containing protein n=1 Tax=Granulicella aggregans TaxID=474949 RepID=UPI0021E0A53B|nr:ATP-binding protein [Granulicella aggregans]
MNLSHFNRIVRQVLFFPVISLVLVAAALSWQIFSSTDTVKLIQDSDQSIQQTNLVGRLISDQESGLRGFEVTSEKSFLAPYDQASDLLPAAFDKLEALKLNASEHQLIAQLRSDHEIWIESYARPVIAMTQASGQEAGLHDLALNQLGKRQMDKIRADLQAVVTADEAHRARRVDHWRVQVRDMVIGLVLFAVVIGIFIGLFTRNRLHVVSDAYQSWVDTLRVKNEELFLSGQQLRTTLASIGDGVITCDIDGRIRMMNQVASDMTGWKIDDALGRPLDTVFHILNGATRQLMEDPVHKVKRVDAIVGLGPNATTDTILVRQDGTEINISDSGAPIRDQDGAITGIVLVFRDVTVAKRTQEALIANEKLAVAGRLAASIAHEIHNPLDSVSNMLYLMGAGSTEEENKQFLQMAQQEIARVTQISRSMLSLYRESTAPIPINIREILSGTLVLLDHRVQDLQSTVHLTAPDDLTIHGFPAELRQVFTNLVINAVEAAGASGHVEVTAKHVLPAESPATERHAAGVLVEILDNGPGISDAASSKLFQPFFSTKGEQGTGLGLWVSRGIVSKHGGMINLESRKDTRGAVARVFLSTQPVISPGGAD